MLGKPPIPPLLAGLVTLYNAEASGLMVSNGRVEGIARGSDVHNGDYVVFADASYRTGLLRRAGVWPADPACERLFAHLR